MTGLDNFQREILTAFFERQRGFFLTGGAALVGFHLKHRTTLDLDLFTYEDLMDEGEQALVESLIRRLTAMAYPDSTQVP